MRPLNLPGYYLKQRAALQRTEEPEALFTKPTAIIIDSDLKTTPSSADNTATIKLLILKEPTELQESEGKRKGGILSCSIVARAIKKQMRPYGRYLCVTVELLQDRVFMAFCIAIFLFSLGAFPPVLFMEDVAQSEGLIDGIALIPLVSIVAMSAGIGKLVLGILADMRQVNSLYVYALTLIGTGAALLLIPVSKSYMGLQVLSAVVGFFSGNWSLTSYITTKIVGIERLSQAHGILMCFGGFGITLGPPVVGKKQQTNTSIVKIEDKSLHEQKSTKEKIQKIIYIYIYIPCRFQQWSDFHCGKFSNNFTHGVFLFLQVGSLTGLSHMTWHSTSVALVF